MQRFHIYSPDYEYFEIFSMNEWKYLEKKQKSESSWSSTKKYIWENLSGTKKYYNKIKKVINKALWINEILENVHCVWNMIAYKLLIYPCIGRSCMCHILRKLVLLIRWNLVLYEINFLRWNWMRMVIYSPLILLVSSA